MKKVSFPRKHLAAAALFQAKQDIRYYLNGVFVEVRDGCTRLVATNGNILAVLTDNTPDAEPGSFIIGSEAVKRLLKEHPKSIYTVTLELHDDGFWDCAQTRGLNIPVPFKPLDGVFPDYRRVIPAPGTPCGDVRAQFDAELTIPFMKAARLLGKAKDHAYIHHAGDSAALVTLADPAFCGVLMPLRSNTLETHRDNAREAVQRAKGIELVQAKAA